MWLVKNFSMKANRILSFTLLTLNIVWGKPGGGGALASWLVEPLVTDIVPIGCTSYSAASLAFQAPTCMYCALHQGIWFFAHLFTPAGQVGCMCVVPGAVSNGIWIVPTCNARAVASSSTCSAWVVASSSTYNAWATIGWSAVSNNSWTGGKKPATSWGWFLSSHFFMDLAQHFFPTSSIAN
jgi:hypothetical protein